MSRTNVYLENFTIILWSRSREGVYTSLVISGLVQPLVISTTNLKIIYNFLFCGRDRARACTPLQDLVQQILKILTQILRFSGSAEIFRG